MYCFMDDDGIFAINSLTFAAINWILNIMMCVVWVKSVRSSWKVCHEKKQRFYMKRYCKSFL